MSILFIIFRILNHVLLISAIAFQLLPTFRDTSCISVVPGIDTAAAKLVSIENIAKLVRIRQIYSSIFFIVF